MKAIVNTAAEILEWQERPMPLPGPGQVRIRTAACGICATDLQMIAGWERTGFPAIPGHEWSGVVDAVGPTVAAALAGKACVAENVLAGGSEVGFEHPGGYAQYFVTEAAKLHVLPASFALDTAALIEPLAVCVHAWRRLQARDPGRALVIGDGPIGLLMLMLMRHAGVKEVSVVGGRTARLALARELGAARVCNYHDAAAGLADAIVETCGGAFPVVIEASGSAAAMEAALHLAAPGGKVLVIGDYADACARFRWNHLLHRELELIGSNASAGAWPDAVRLATAGTLALERLITQRFPASQFAAAVELVRTSREAVKVLLQWPMADG